MTKTPIPLHVNDMTGFTRALTKQLGMTSPSHLTMMNMVARAAGFQNIQHMRAATAAAKRLAKPVQEDLADARKVERGLHQFDQYGLLLRWPSKRAVQDLALWAIWSALPANTSLSEQHVNALLISEHHFKDPATLRRTMICNGLLTRQKDGSDYRRIEQKPPIEAKMIIQTIAERRRTRPDNA